MEIDGDWMIHWINDLVSEEIIDSMTFKEWMTCPERYISVDVLYMGMLWKKRKEKKDE